MAREVDLAGLDRAVLSAHEIGEAASKIAVMPDGAPGAGRGAARLSRRAPGTVLDGRDIGTVVCPDAPVKLYVTASPEVRASRRYDEIIGKGGAADFDAIFEDMKRRDERDMGRADSPLKTGRRCALA